MQQSYNAQNIQAFTPGNQDKLNLLRYYDTVFLIDDSYSMATVEKGGLTRWQLAGMSLGYLAELATRYDNNGVDVYFLNNPSPGKNMRTRQEVANLFNQVQVKKENLTPTGSRIDAVLRQYFHRPLKFFGPRIPNKMLNLIVITDGIPFPTYERPEACIRNWVQYMNQLRIPPDRRQSIMFAQVGWDQEARQHLQELDNMPIGRDIVDTFDCNLTDVQSWSAEDWNFNMTKLLLGAIDPTIDQMQRVTPQQQPFASTSASAAPPAYYQGSNASHSHNYNQGGKM